MEKFEQCTKRRLLYLTKKFYKDVKRLIRQKIELCEQIKQMEIESDCGHCYKLADEKLTKATEIIKKLYKDCYSIADVEDMNLGLWEEDLNQAQQFLNGENIILEDAQVGNSPFDADEVFNKEMKAFKE